MKKSQFIAAGAGDAADQLIDRFSALLFAALRPPLRLSAAPSPSPANFASLLLGVAMALMLCGSLTLFVGFILMPWVIGFMIAVYFVGVVSNLSGFGRAILCSGGPKVYSGPICSKLPLN